VITAFLNAPIQIKKINGCHCVLGSGEGTAIIDAVSMVAEIVARVKNSPVKVMSIAPPVGLLDIESRNFVADISFLMKNCVLTYPHKIEDGILKALRQYC